MLLLLLIIVAAAIALKVTLHEDYIYHMPVTAVITDSIKAYPRHQLVSMKHCPSMAYGVQ